MRLTCILVPVLLGQLAIAQGVIVIYPAPTSVEKGTTRQFSTYITVSPSNVSWSVNGITGGNSTIGTVTQAGLYTSPALIPPANVVKVRATSYAQASVFGESAVTLSQPTPYVWSSYPNALTTGAGQMIQLNGSGFIPQSIVQVNGIAWMTTYLTPTSLKATGDLLAAGTYQVTVSQPDPGGLISQPVKITVTVAPPQPVSVSVSPSSIQLALAATNQFTATVSGSSNQAVTWMATAGTISAAGLYTAPAAMPAAQVVTIRATSVADATKSAQASVTLKASTGGGTPGNNGADLTAGRFLEQAAFGPTPSEIAKVQSLGINSWLDSQFAMQETVISLPPSNQSASVQSQTLSRITMAPDQLRQKMAWVLGQFIVISMNKNIYPDEYVPYQQILSRNAFGNYRTLLSDIAKSPQMGKYLDMANSNKPAGSSGANENFARELMQLFTIGLNQLNTDGSTKLVNGQPTPNYMQADVRQVALALTGWTYPTAAGATPRSNNWEDFSQPVMETRPANHDSTQKTFLGCTLPTGQTVQQDLDGVLDCVFNHPNAGPFVATRLIRSLVTSNPTPAFIQRIGAVFNNNGGGVRGDLQAVLRAILTDPEARQDSATLTSGKLKDPIYTIISFTRMMNGSIAPGTVIPWNFVAMGQSPANPPSVFGYYSPMYRLPLNPTLFGPEYQIYTPTESVVLANMLYQMINQPNSDPVIDLSPFTALAGNTAQLLDLVDQRLFYGRMPAAMRTSLANAIDASYDNNQRVQTALYLAALSGQYQTQF